MGRGDLTRPISATSSKEVSVLAHELELMRQALLARDRQLQLMLSGIAHEVKNPLGGIELFAGLLREELPEGDTRSHVDRILGELDYLKRVVEEFLSFAREQMPARAPFAIERLVQSLLPLVSADAQAKEVRLDTNVEPAQLNGDNGLITAALVNLVRNAIHAAPPRTRVTVRGQRTGTRYRMEVQDEGPGVPAELQERIFEPFFSTREKGTGLGLPLAQRIVQAHGGQLGLHSRPGETVFWTELPFTPHFPAPELQEHEETHGSHPDHR
jgi:signal transduction histidine kinase